MSKFFLNFFTLKVSWLLFFFSFSIGFLKFSIKKLDLIFLFRFSQLFYSLGPRHIKIQFCWIIYFYKQFCWIISSRASSTQFDFFIQRTTITQVKKQVNCMPFLIWIYSSLLIGHINIYKEGEVILVFCKSQLFSVVMMITISLGMFLVYFLSGKSLRICCLNWVSSTHKYWN